MKKVINKKYFTLIEVLVATALLSVLLIALFGTYRQMTQMNRQLNFLRSESFQIRYAEFRLASMLPKALISLGVVHESSGEQFYFYTCDDSCEYMQAGSLVFVCERGPDIESAFAGNVFVRLYLNSQEQLCLGMWPLPKEWEEGETPPMRKEILLDKVSSLSFAFYMPPSLEQKQVDTERVNPEKRAIEHPSYDTWHPRWERHYNGLPAMVKVMITRRNLQEEEEQITLGFILHHSKRMVTYPVKRSL